MLQVILLTLAALLSVCLFCLMGFKAVSSPEPKTPSLSPEGLIDNAEEGNGHPPRGDSGLHEAFGSREGEKGGEF